MILGEDRITALEAWARETAEALRIGESSLDKMKLMIGLIQARAQEARHQAGELMLTQADPTLRGFAGYLNDRAHKLEEFGLALAERYTRTNCELLESGRIVN